MESSDYLALTTPVVYRHPPHGIHCRESWQGDHDLSRRYNKEEVLPESGPRKGEAAKLKIADAFNRFIKAFEVEGECAGFCGLYGFTSFNAVRYFENIEVKDTTMEKNDAPDIYYIMYRDLIVFDHYNNTVTLVTLSTGEDEGATQLAEMEKAMNKGNVQPYGFKAIGETTSTLSDEEHKANIRQCVKHCLRGDVFQIVISRRFVQRYEGTTSSSTGHCVYQSVTYCSTSTSWLPHLRQQSRDSQSHRRRHGVIDPLLGQQSEPQPSSTRSTLSFYATTLRRMLSM
jgi:anthranilate/para-aminobenzoate synthase component I